MDSGAQKQATGQANTEETRQQPSTQKGKPLILLTGIILSVAAITIGYMLLFPKHPADRQIKPELPPTVSASPTSLPTQIILPSTAVSTVLPSKSPESLQFVSQKLGIGFSYASALPEQPDSIIKTLEEGDKVYVYAASITKNPQDGQWVEVFQKDPNLTLADAIKKQFLANYSSADCFVSLQSRYPDSVKLPDNYEVAEISYPAPSDTTAPGWANADKCPQMYTTTNGISYFAMDKNHPDKYAYFSIGQYGIPSGTTNKQSMWQDTFRFIK